MPQFEASSFISLNEHFERRYYSGFIGFNDGKNIDLYVNLRCMELQHNKVVLYAGAGITKDSDPNKEWDETEKKMQTLKNLFWLFV